jgi:hypothetical protein
VAETTATTRGSLRAVQGPRWAFMMQRIINPLMARALASRRLHRLMGSDTLMLLSFRGRKSGSPYSFPIGYMQTGSELICYTPFRWWANLQGGAPVIVTLRGRRLVGTADVCTDIATIADGMAVYLRHNPGDARFWKVRMGADRSPVRSDVDRAARENVQIRIPLADGWQGS